MTTIEEALPLDQWIVKEINAAYAQGCNSGFYYECDPKLLEAARAQIYTKEDAERYRKIQMKVSAPFPGTFDFSFIRPLANLHKGSVSGHLDDAVDALAEEGGV